MRAPAIVASVLGADYARLGQEVAELEAAGVDRIQWTSWTAAWWPTYPDGRPAAVAELRRSLQPDVEALRE